MKKINIAELLKDCPKGMELDCTMYEDVYFDHVKEQIIYCYIQRESYRTDISFNNRGTVTGDPKSKCVIFPKGKTTWDGFHRPFKDGDIVTWDDRGSLVACIYKERKNTAAFNHHIALYKGGLGIVENGEIALPDSELSFATEEKKLRLFAAIKENGYKWNTETKTLEKLIEPKFKIEKGKWYVCIKNLLDNYTNKAFCKGDTYYSPEDGYLIPNNSNVLSKVEYCTDEYFRDWTIQDAKDGDVIFYDDGWTCIFKCVHGIWYSSYCFITDDGEFHTGYERHAIDSKINGNAHPATKEQCNLLFQKIKEAGYKWNPKTNTLEELIVPKFKVGDKIRHRNIETNNIYTIIGIKDLKYVLKKDNEEYIYEIKIKAQDDWVLVPKKFDITTLKPFDKVLVRCNELEVWHISFFEKYDKELTRYPFVCLNSNKYSQCIPYKDNEYLLDTADKCDDFYKTWK